MRKRSSKIEARPVMLRGEDMASLMKIQAKMTQDVRRETGILVDVPYATILHNLIEREAKRLGVKPAKAA
jgi:hypothetical protein